VKKNIRSICFSIVLVAAVLLLLSAVHNQSLALEPALTGGAGGSMSQTAAGHFFGMRNSHVAVAPALQEPPLDDDEEEDDDDDDDFTCFFSTSLHDSPFADDLDILREFRDRFLMPNRPGRWIVRLYYRISPPLAVFVAEHQSAKTAAKTVTKSAIRLIGLCNHEFP